MNDETFLFYFYIYFFKKIYTMLYLIVLLLSILLAMQKLCASCYGIQKHIFIAIDYPVPPFLES